MEKIDKNLISRIIGSELKEDFQIEKLTGGYLSEIFRIKLSNKSFILKFAPSFGKEYKFFEREVLFYVDILPNITFNSPKCFFHELDLQTSEGFLVLEDLGNVKSKNLSLNDSKEVLKLAASLHSNYWNMKNECELIFSKYEMNIQNLIEKKSKLLLDFSRDPSKDSRFIDLFDKNVLKNIEIFLEKGYDKLIEIYSKLSNTICHGDIWTNNVFEKDSKFYIFDFMTSYNSGLIDIACFIYSSIEVNDIKENLDELLDLYYKELTCKRNLNNQDVQYDYQQFKQDFELAKIPASLFVLITFDFFGFDRTKYIINQVFNDEHFKNKMIG